MIIDLETKREFSRLCGELSPENLTCDGELPRKMVRAKARLLEAEWAALERKVGRKVIDTEVYSWYEEIQAADKIEHDARVAAEFTRSGLDPEKFWFNGTGVWGRKGQPSQFDPDRFNHAYTIRNPKRQNEGFVIKGMKLTGKDVYQLESHIADELGVRFGELGEFPTLEEAIQAGEEFIAPIDADYVRARCPQMNDQAVQRLLRYLP